MCCLAAPIECRKPTVDSKLLFANKDQKDIFLYEELSLMLRTNFINILSREKKDNFLYGHINPKILKDQISRPNQPFYICGPGNFAEQIRDQLLELGIDKDMINIREVLKIRFFNILQSNSSDQIVI